MTSHGKWSQPGVPHKDWVCVGVEDLGAPDETCGMCESMAIRYVHYMRHPNFAGDLGCGCHCAARMEANSLAAESREAVMKSNAGRRSRWLTRKWKRSKSGNPYLKTRDDFHVVVFRDSRDSTKWAGCVTDTRFKRKLFTLRKFAEESAAKLAAFDVMLVLEFCRKPGVDVNSLGIRLLPVEDGRTA